MARSRMVRVGSGTMLSSVTSYTFPSPWHCGQAPSRVLGEKASGETYSSYDKEIITAMCRHIGVAIAQRNMLAELEKRSEEWLRALRMRMSLSLSFHRDTTPSWEKTE